MPFKDILVSVDASDTGRQRMDFALRLARRHGAHLTGYFTSPTVGDAPQQTVEDLVAATQEAFEAGLSASGGSWLLSGESLESDIVAKIRDCDLAVLGLDDPDDPSRRPQGFGIEAVVLTCGRPVLGVPISGGPEPFPTRVLVAWDGSREAARSMNDALPFLQEAAEVEVASIGRNGHALSGRAVAHLARHGVAAKAGTSAMLLDDVGSELLDRASAFDADLVVAGAYGHLPITENLFGGATRSLVRQMLVPVLLSH
jgi:nucleotide-binding universal stress UspA family protein